MVDLMYHINMLRITYQRTVYIHVVRFQRQRLAFRMRILFRGNNQNVQEFLISRRSTNQRREKDKTSCGSLALRMC